MTVTTTKQGRRAFIDGPKTCAVIVAKRYKQNFGQLTIPKSGEGIVEQSGSIAEFKEVYLQNGRKFRIANKTNQPNRSETIWNFILSFL